VVDDVNAWINYPREPHGPTRHQMIMLRDHLIPTKTVKGETLWRLWRHHYDVIQSRDIIVDVTVWRPLATFL